MGFASYSGLIEHSSIHNRPLYPSRTFKAVTRTLTSCLEEKKVKEIFVLGIDVEGNELNVLKGLDFNRWKPRIIFCEKAFKLETSFQEDFLRDKGYELVDMIDWDQVYFLKEDT